MSGENNLQVNNAQENTEVENNVPDNNEVENNNLQNNEIEDNNLENNNPEHDDFEVVNQNAEHFDKMHNAYLTDLRKTFIEDNNKKRENLKQLYDTRIRLYDRKKVLQDRADGLLSIYDVAEFDELNNPIFPKDEKDINGEKIDIVTDLIDIGILVRDENDHTLGIYSTDISRLKNFFKDNVVNGENDPRLKNIIESIEKQKQDALDEQPSVQDEIDRIEQEINKAPKALSDEKVNSIDSFNKYRSESLINDIGQYSDIIHQLSNVAYHTGRIISDVALEQVGNENDPERKAELEKEWTQKSNYVDDLYFKLKEIDETLNILKIEDRTKIVQDRIKNLVDNLNNAQSMLATCFNDYEEFRNQYKGIFNLNVSNDELSENFFEKANDIDLLTGKAYQLDEHLSNMVDGRLFVPPTNQEKENSKDIIRVKEVTGNEKPEEIERLKNEGYKLVKTPLDADNKECKYINYKNRPLFEHEPKPGDIVQPYLGNCYMVGTLNSIVHQDPDRIHDLIVDNNDGTCTVKFYNAFDEPTYVTVEKTLPKTIYENGLKTPLWQEMITKAYAVSGLHNSVLSRTMIQNNLEKASYHDIEGGLPDLFLKNLLGPNIDGSAADYHSYWTELDYDKSKPYTESELNTVKTIENALKEGKYVSAATKLTFMFAPTEVVVFDEEQQREFDRVNNNKNNNKNKNAEPHRKIKTGEKEQKNEKSGIYTKHVYTITGVERDQKTGKIYLDIVNPHASGGVETGEDGKLHYIEGSKAKGHMKLELKDYNKYFWASYVYNVDVTKDRKAKAVEGKEFARDYYDVITNINKKLSDTDNIFMKLFNPKEFGEFRDALKSAADELNSPLANKEIIQNKMQTLFEKAKLYQDRCENVKGIDKNLNKESFREVQRYKMAKMIEEVKNIYTSNTTLGKHDPCDFRMISNKIDIPTNAYQEMKKVERVSSKLKTLMENNTLHHDYVHQLVMSIADVIKDSSVLDKNIGSKSDKDQLNYVKKNENTIIAAEFFVNNYDLVKKKFAELLPEDSVQKLYKKIEPQREELRLKLEKFKLNSDTRTYQIEHPGLDYKTFTPKAKNQAVEKHVQNQIQL